MNKNRISSSNGERNKPFPRRDIEAVFKIFHRRCGIRIKKVEKPVSRFWYI